jgi:hypothetical protein
MKKEICPSCKKSKFEKDFFTKTRKNKICNTCKRKQGKLDSIKGAGNELLVLGSLIYSYPNTMMSSSAQTAHDLIIHINSKKNIRAQVKTVNKNGSIPLKGGGRSGADANYGGKGTINKIYLYSTENCDLIIGVNYLSVGHFELYFVPGLVLDKLQQQSISIRKIQFTKNDLSIVEKCLDDSYAEIFLEELK